MRLARPTKKTVPMDEASNKWMAYIDTEVRAACENKGWGVSDTAQVICSRQARA